MPQEKTILGHLLRANTSIFTVGTRVDALEAQTVPLLGSLCAVQGQGGSTTYGLVANIQLMDDGLVQQLVAEGRLGSELRSDNRYNRNQPVELSVISLGFDLDGTIHQRLPGTPPLSLEALRLCEPAEGLAFCLAGDFSYLRHILNQVEYPAQELIVAHADQVNSWQPAQSDPQSWYPRMTQALIRTLRNDYERITLLLDALSDLERSWK